MSKVQGNLRETSRFEVLKVAFVSRQKLERLNKTKMAAQRDAETFSKQVPRVRGPRGADQRRGLGLGGPASRRQSRPQVSRLHLQSQQLADENRMLTERDAQSIAEMETLQQQLAGLMEDSKKREAAPKEDKSQVNGVWRQAAAAAAVVANQAVLC